MNNELRIQASRITRDMHMNVVVTGTRVMALRFRLGAWLIHLAALVMGVGGVDVEVEQR